MKRLSCKKAYIFIITFIFLIIATIPWGAASQAKKIGHKKKMEQFWLKAYPGMPAPVKSKKSLTTTLLAKAKPDECFDGIGYPYPLGAPECSQGGIPKVNQAYVWGLAKSGDNLWFGTAPNVHCLVSGGYLGNTIPNQTACSVCEFGDSQLSKYYEIPAIIGDWRPSQIFVYNTATKILTDKTPNPFVEARIRQTIGLRSAGAIGNVVVLGGPSLLGGINLFAFNTESGAYLGSTTLYQYSNIRKWLVINDVLYTTVGNNGEEGEGSVLRWTGDLDNPFQFDVVFGAMDGSGAELAYHEKRLFISTWPESGGLAGLWMSPPIPKTGLTGEHNQQGLWKKVWQVDNYEPDFITAKTYGGGALASFDGYLYWGTMHIPFTAAMMHFELYGTPDNQEEVLATILGTYRAISIFRGRKFSSKNPKIQLVYGMANLPKYTSQGWEIVPNNMDDPNPLWGPSGFGNFFNNYTWTMEVYNKRLYVGTMDWSFLLKTMLDSFLDELNLSFIPDEALEFPSRFCGADLFSFSSAKSPAIAQSLDGVGNYTNYGIRTMVSDDALYLGMANPMNLLTDLNDDLPEGGWELIQLSTHKKGHSKKGH